MINDESAEPLVAQSVLESSDKKRFIRKSCPLLFYRLSNRAHRGSLGASGDQTAQVSFPVLPGQTVSKLFGALFVALDALFFVSFYFFRCLFF